ncbi:uncharacterized protein LOC8288268 [Ricinus communis]|uniref:Uncharacterized protein n=1 Tax=Ricinus communis TaxID=3988 RepID=B9SEW3_RICCO|nr:uncharacterized protein LOC8288268 [Ricinus communis]EEF37859.1 conserved hypothetical protein [Ricinus communis]|eukprot:XP_002524532.1 uncharacterized protein LOC8288268 [Ricinus communis]
MAQLSRVAAIFLIIALACHFPSFEARKLSVMDLDLSVSSHESGDLSKIGRFLKSVPTPGAGHYQVLQAVPSNGIGNYLVLQSSPRPGVGHAIGHNSEVQYLPSPEIGNGRVLAQSVPSPGTGN